jgi:F-type H+-transporting ATPase subunit a
VKSNKIVVLLAIAILALALTGFVMGAIGSKFFGGERFISLPEVHLAPYQVLGDHAGHAVHGGGQFLITNTLLSSIVASWIILALFLYGSFKMRLIPGRIQSVVEVAVEGLLGFVESVVGTQRGRQVFPLIATIFLFVLVNAWVGLLPVYQSFGFLQENELKATLLRPAGTDINMPLALALVSFVFVESLGFRTFGFRYLAKFIRLNNLLRGKIFMGFIDLFVGILELLSEFVRLISFTFRLFGNMLAGEILLLVSAFLVPFVFTVPFYGLELLVGAVQALIFAGLTLVFAAMALIPHGEEH